MMEIPRSKEECGFLSTSLLSINLLNNDAMQTYTLNTLLQFFEAQRLLDYEAIETIIGILEIEDMPDSDKHDAILYTLRKHGMNEVTHKGGRFEPAEKNTIPVKP